MKKAVFINNVKANLSVRNRAEAISEYIGAYSDENAPCPYQLIYLDPLSIFDENKPSPALVLFESYDNDPDKLMKEQIFTTIVNDISDPVFTETDDLEVFTIGTDAPAEIIEGFKAKMTPFTEAKPALESLNDFLSNTNSTGGDLGYGLTAADLADVIEDEGLTTVGTEEMMPTEEMLRDMGEEPITTLEPTDVVEIDEVIEPAPVPEPKEEEVPATPIVNSTSTFFNELEEELKRLNGGELPTANAIAAALLWFIRDKSNIDDTVSEEDYSYQNAIAYVERPLDEQTQYVMTTESADGINYLVDKKDLEDVRKNIMSDLIDGLGEFLSGSPKAASILTIKECRAFMRKVNKCGLNILNRLKKTAFIGVNSGYKSKIKYTNDICENYQIPPLVTSDVVRGLAIPILSSSMTMDEVKTFFGNQDLINKVYATVMEEVYNVLVDAKLAKYSSLHYISFRQNPDKHYLVIIIETGVKLVTQDEKDRILAEANAPRYESVQQDKPTDENVTVSLESVIETTGEPTEENMDDVFAQIFDMSETTEKEPVNEVTENLVEEPIEEVKPEPKSEVSPSLEGMDLVRELAKSVTTDDELFEKMCEYKDKVGYECMNDALNYNMMAMVKDGIKINNNPTVQNSRLVRSFSW